MKYLVMAYFTFSEKEGQTKINDYVEIVEENSKKEIANERIQILWLGNS